MANHEHDPSFLQRLDDFAEGFREDFRRRDQARWAAVYLQGLLLPAGERKTIGTMARRVVLPPDLLVEDIAQALQNFVNQSPWDERLINRRLRGRLAARFADPDGAFVIDELAVAKQGRYSVGVHRQYSSVLGRKTNCQVASILYHSGAAGICPLALRLYLPRNWLNNVEQLDAAGVPDENRRPQTKAAIALELLDEARSEGWSARTVVSGTIDGDLRAALRDRGLSYLAEAEADRSAETDEHVGHADETGVSLLSNLPIDDGLRRAWRAKMEARGTGRSLLQDFGLEHFEGRSWRGFHHHATLVVMAFAFRQLCRDKSGRCVAVS
jgi:SRSO17 transposase